MKVIIVGAGLGGLTAAYCLARDGHTVDLYERRSSFEAKGGAILIRQSAARLLRHWGMGPNFEAVSDRVGATVLHNGITSEVFANAPQETTTSEHWATFRKEAQEFLYRRAVEEGVRFHFGLAATRVSDTKDAALLQLSSGADVSADIILIADGILSRLRSQVIPGAPEPVPGSSTVNQILVPEEEILTDGDARKLLEVEEESDLHIWLGAEGEYTVGRFKRDSKLYSMAFGIPEIERDDQKLWDEHGNLEYVQARFKHFHPSLIALLKLAKSCDRWRLAEMPDLPRWASESGRLMLLGDSAHAMFPDAGFGYSSIVEDIACLSHLLNRYSHVGIYQIALWWQDIRIPRVNRLKAWAKTNHDKYTKRAEPPSSSSSEQKDDEAESIAESESVEGAMFADFTHPAFLRWAYEYDVLQVTERHVRDQQDK